MTRDDKAAREWSELTDERLDLLTARGCFDWLSAADFFDVAARESGPDPAYDAVVALDLAARLLEQGLARPGHIESGRFVAWNDRPVDDIKSEILDRWFFDPHGSLVDGWVFFELTEAGLARARDTLDHKGAPTTRPNYCGAWLERPDGVKVGRRFVSQRGGAVVDILHPDGRLEQVQAREAGA